MSLTEELRAIANLKDFDSVKHKRAFRRGQMTKLKTKVDALKEKPLRDIKLLTVQDLYQSACDTAELHNALQVRYSELLYETKDHGLNLEEEEKKDDEILDHQKDIVSEAKFMTNIVDYYQKGVTLKSTVETLIDIPELHAPVVLEEVQKLKSQVTDYQVNTMDFIDDDRLAPLRQQLNDTVKSLNIRLADEHKKSVSEKAESSILIPPATTIVNNSSFKIDLPTFSGRSVDWFKFHDLFIATMEKRGTHLSDPERCCLLLKSMTTEDAKSVVHKYETGKDAYSSALKALTEAYGQPRQIYPQHVRALLANDKYSYTKASLRHMRETIEAGIRGLDSVKGKTFEQFFAAIVIDRFDPEMLREWTTHISTKADTSLPEINEILQFFRKREFSLLEEESQTIPKANNKKAFSHSPVARFGKSQLQTPVLRVATSQCPLCAAEDHSLLKCQKFQVADAISRQKMVKDAKHCTNCLGPHSWAQCQSKFTCRTCNKKHHTSLHRENSSEANKVPAFIASSKRSSTQELLPESAPKAGLLPSAVVEVKNGPRVRRGRVAFDSGSGVSLMTEALASSLRLKRYPHNLVVDGIVGDGRVKSYVVATLQSTYNPEDKISLSFCVVPKIPATHPPCRPDIILQDPVVRGLKQFADPQLGGSLDALIGSLDIHKCNIGNPVKSANSPIVATPTLFGWTLVGPVEHDKPQPVFNFQTKEDNLQQSLERLWEMDKVPEEIQMKDDDQLAMEHFADTHEINAEGRYVVKLPRVPDPPELGNSRAMAVKRFEQNERSLRRRGLLEKFTGVVNEYFEMDHAESVPPEEISCPKNPVYYMPVHGVTRESSTTTKLRAVFDASAKSSNGVALNELLLTGPTLHPMLTDILLRFRLHKIACSADIGKMFREICLHPEERDLHRFLRRKEDGKLEDSRMKRVTFGVRSSPFLATRVIRDLAEKHSDSHFLASKAILTCFYVDDFLSGAETVEKADALRRELCSLFNSTGMTLRKWRSNSEEFRNTIPQDLIEATDLTLPAPLSAPKALGMHWDVSRDNLHIAVPEILEEPQVTKRQIASQSSKVYDVLGLFSPATIIPKILLQEAWKSKTPWDRPVPESTAIKWNSWTDEIQAVAKRPIPRRICSSERPAIFQSIHGFADASTAAYGAVVYLRIVHDDTSVSTSLIYSKSRVAPVKSITVPRLELLAAQLLAKVICYISKIYEIPSDQVYAWTDSEIVLCWLRRPPSAWKTFVSHRIAEIQQILPHSKWHHVRSKDNPADLISRGVSPSLLVSCELWWNGPEWLKFLPDQWPSQKIITPKLIPESKCSAPVLISPASPTPASFWTKYSSFNCLVRVISWIIRFFKNCLNPASRITEDILTSYELQQTKMLLFRLSQKEAYPEVFETLSSGKELHKSHPLRHYNVSIQDDRLIHIAGRVRQKEDPKLPNSLIPLSLKSSLTKLFVSSQHINLFHPNVSSLLCVLAEKYHIPGLKRYLKQLSRRCVTCQKAYSQPLVQTMGMLPCERTTPSPPFYITGIDFAGPFQIRQGYTRRPVIVKAYACVFVCFSTKAVHLELCADLTTPEFMAAFRRFCARRGTPSQVYSDNGSNFVGARNEMEDIKRLILSKDTRQSISHLSTTTDIKWHFIPPRTPHHGGLWEAAVKSMKTLLRKMVSPQLLTFEELTTILIEAEAILNSRPIVPVYSTDADAPLALTSGHFLIGRPIKAPPARNSKDFLNTSLYKRWNRVQSINQELWIEWSSRYLQSLSARSKWHRATSNLKIGDIVLVKDELLKQRGWPLAKVSKTYPGDDGKVRAVDIMCQGKSFHRGINRLVLLVQETQSHQLVPPQDVQVSSNSNSPSPHKE